MINKKAFRKKKRAEISVLPQDYIERSNEAIAERLLTLPEFQQAKRLFAYCSVGREVDTQAIIKAAAKLGKEIFLPVVLGNGIMEYARFENESLLSPGSLQIPEPGPEAVRDTPKSEDLLLVPGLCFDANRFRQGQGGGYYDRFLPGLPCPTVGLARERLMPVSVPRETHDMAVDILLTESRTLR